VARRTLALLRARGVLEEEAAPDEHSCSSKASRYRGAGRVLPLAGRAAGVSSSRASPSTPTPGSTRTTSRASSGSATTAPPGPCRSSDCPPYPTVGSPTE
jgi:hypothetical protein